MTTASAFAASGSAVLTADPVTRPAGPDAAGPGVAGGTSEAGQVLAWARELLLPALRSAVDGLPEQVRAVAGYHFGWLDESGRPARESPGKLLRPALTLLCAQGAGGPAGSGLQAAVAVELLHNFSLRHDDVMDGDLTRRHRRTAWSLFGAPAAILAGDSLLALAIGVLAETPGSVATLCATTQDLIRGQSLDVSFEQRDDVSVAECLEMVSGKTAALLRCACELGARHGGGSPGQVAALREFGWHLGIAFQFADDLLGIWGDPQVTGKPALADLRARKKSLPVVAALAAGGPHSRELAEMYLGPQPLASRDLPAVARLIELGGGRAWAEAEAEHHVAAALDRLTAAVPPGAPREALVALAALVTRRAG
ncbi:MAG TPA: polyprenyl synthetase family protein [Streptosporangiaceae bacterium]